MIFILSSICEPGEFFWKTRDIGLPSYNKKSLYANQSYHFQANLILPEGPFNVFSASG